MAGHPGLEGEHFLPGIGFGVEPAKVGRCHRVSLAPENSRIQGPTKVS